MFGRKILLGLAPEAVLEIRQYRTELLNLKPAFEMYLDQSLKTMKLERLDGPFLVDGFYESLVGGYYQDIFYTVQYRQALQCYGKDYSLNDVAKLIDRTMQFLVEKSQTYSALLPLAIKDVLVLSLDIFAYIFGLFTSIERMKQRSGY